MRELSLERDARKAPGDRVAVSADGPHVFVYTTREAAAERPGPRSPPAHRAHLTDTRFALTRWHPEEERWERWTSRCPRRGGARRRARGRGGRRGHAETAEQGFAEWEVRVELPSHGATGALRRAARERRDPGRCGAGSSCSSVRQRGLPTRRPPRRSRGEAPEGPRSTPRSRRGGVEGRRPVPVRRLRRPRR
jgi:hypothetical protein